MARRRSTPSWERVGSNVRGTAQEAGGRTAGAWLVLRGSRVVTRRWTWALLAGLAGAGAATLAVMAAGRLLAGPTRPDALEPEQLEAVVDRGSEAAGAAATDRTISLLDEDRPAQR